MKKFEYWSGSPGTLEDEEDYMKRLGDNGWELLFIVGGRYYWKRDKQ